MSTVPIELIKGQVGEEDTVIKALSLSSTQNDICSTNIPRVTSIDFICKQEGDVWGREREMVGCGSLCQHVLQLIEPLR